MMSTCGTIAMLLMLVMAMTWQSVNGNGRLVEPPSRSSMWRYGFDTPINYNDDNLNCGGLNTRWKMNGGKCGVCGDLWNQPSPRDNEAGGRYGNGIITRHYTPGRTVEVSIEVTITRRGWFQFRLCPHDSPTTPITQQCLDQHLLELADGSGTRYTLSSSADRFIVVPVKLPLELNCTQCVLQWRWHADNSSGDNQMEFFGCSDIAIETPSDSTTSRLTPTPTVRQIDPLTTTAAPMPAPGYQNTGPCHGINVWFGQPELDDYCNKHCPQGDCPPNFCACPGLATGQPTTAPSIAPPVTTSGSQIAGLCRGINDWQGKPQLDSACNDLCQQGNCPLQHCSCSGISTSLPTTTTPRVTTTAFRMPTTGGQSMGPCHGVNTWQGLPELDRHCNEMCTLGNCPPEYCSCSDSTLGLSTAFRFTTTVPPTTHPTSATVTASTTSQVSPSGPCRGINAWQGKPSLDHACNDLCLHGNCPFLYCSCTGSVTDQSTTTASTTPSVSTSGHCYGINAWQGIPDMDLYCQEQCPHNNCPSNYCSCSTVGQPTTTPPTVASTAPTLPTPGGHNTAQCHGINAWQGIPELDRYCQQQCPGSNCPFTYCSCPGSTAPSTILSQRQNSASVPTSPSTVSSTHLVPTTISVLSPTIGLVLSTTTGPALSTTTSPAISTTTSPPLSTTTSPVLSTTTSPILSTTTDTVSTTVAVQSTTTGCFAIGNWQGDASKDKWCNENCPIGLCPSYTCQCGPDTTTSLSTTSTSPAASSSTVSNQLLCHAVGSWAGKPDLERWCSQNCPQDPGCDARYCQCDSVSTSPAPSSTTAGQHHCHGVGTWAGKSEFDQWCSQNCPQNGCDSRYCQCD